MACIQNGGDVSTQTSNPQSCLNTKSSYYSFEKNAIVSLFMRYIEKPLVLSAIHSSCKEPLIWQTTILDKNNEVRSNFTQKEWHRLNFTHIKSERHHLWPREWNIHSFTLRYKIKVRNHKAIHSSMTSATYAVELSQEFGTAKI